MLCGDVWISQCVVWRYEVSVLCGGVWICQCIVLKCVNKSVCCVEMYGLFWFRSSTGRIELSMHAQWKGADQRLLLIDDLCHHTSSDSYIIMFPSYFFVLVFFRMFLLFHLAYPVSAAI